MYYDFYYSRIKLSHKVSIYKIDDPKTYNTKLSRPIVFIWTLKLKEVELIF